MIFIIVAYNNFFNSLKKNSKQDAKYPKFHKKGKKDSFRIACTYSKKGSGSESHPRDLRLQFFETQEQCRSLKQEISSTLSIGRKW